MDRKSLRLIYTPVFAVKLIVIIVIDRSELSGSCDYFR